MDIKRRINRRIEKRERRHLRNRQHQQELILQ